MITYFVFLGEVIVMEASKATIFVSVFSGLWDFFYMIFAGRSDSLADYNLSVDFLKRFIETLLELLLLYYGMTV